MKRDNLWAYSFRLGLYDSLMPVNYDRSLQESFAILHPAQDARILDVGCGGGRLLDHAHTWLEGGGHITGVDLEEDGILYAMQRAKRLGVSSRVSLRVCDMRHLDTLHVLPMDGAIAHFSVYVLPEERDRRAVVHHVAGLLRPGAKLVISVPSEGYRADTILEDIARIEDTRTDVSPLVRTMRRRVINDRIQRAIVAKSADNMDRGVFHRYTYDELVGHLHDAGFDDVEVERIYNGCGYRAVATRAGQGQE